MNQLPKMRPTRRASNEKEKQERLREILDAAMAVCMETSYGGLTVAQVAERAGIAKGTVYLYFPSKDALGLALERQLLTAWLDDLQSTLMGASRGLAPMKLAGLVGGTVHQHERAFRVLTSMRNHLERTADPGEIVANKALLLRRLAESGTALERLAPFLAPGQGGQLLFFAHALAISLCQEAEYGPELEPLLLRHPGLRRLQKEVSALVAEALRLQLEGLRAIRTGNPDSVRAEPHGLSPEVVASALAQEEPPSRGRRWWELPRSK